MTSVKLINHSSSTADWNNSLFLPTNDSLYADKIFSPDKRLVLRNITDYRQPFTNTFPYC